MPITPLGLPYPDPDGANDVPAHIKALAESIDDDVLGPNGRLIPIAQDAAADYLASTPGVTAAAATAAGAAVDDALDDAGLLHGAYEIDPLDDESLTFAVTDDSGRRSWIEVTDGGKPSAHATALIRQGLTEDGAALGEPAVALGVDYALTDSQGRIALAVGSDGSVDIKPGSRLRTYIEQVVDDAPPAPSQFVLDDAGLALRAVSGPDYCHAGDSLTAFDGIRVRLAELTGRTHRSAAVGGENSYGIAARLNALPYLMRPVGGVIPASGSVDVTFQTMLPGVSWPLLQGDGGGATGTLAGVPVTFSIRVKDPATPYPSHGDGDVYQLTRIGSGAAVPIKRPTAFLYDYGEARRGDVLIAWHGQNGTGASWTGPSVETGGQQFLDDIVGISRAMVENLTPAAPRYLFMTRTGIESIGWTDEERAMSREFGRRYLNVRRYLIDQALSDLNITPTGQDVADKTAGRVPTSLRIDAVHHTADAQAAIAEFLIYPRLTELGWI